MDIRDVQAISQRHGIEFTFDIMPSQCIVLAWTEETQAGGKQDLLGTGTGTTPDAAMDDVMQHVHKRLN